MSQQVPSRPLGLLVFASGAAALVYQSLWLRSFGLVFGSTTDAVAVVLVVFMGGLAAGGALIARLAVRHPLRAYALVEMAIGLSACATLPLLRGLPRLYASVDVVRSLEGPVDVLVRAAAAGAVLLVPTMLLGATIPLAVESQARLGRNLHASLGRLYLLNTLGGAAGVTLAPFVLLPELGLRGAFVAAALVNIFVGLVAWRFSLETGEAGSTEEVPVRTKATIPNRPKELDGTIAASATRTPEGHALFPALAAMSGAFTFGLEVVWTRSLALVLGSSVYAFASMLLAVLLGLCAGAVVYDRWRHRLGDPVLTLGRLFLGAGALALASFLVIGQLPGIFLALMRALPVTFAAHVAAGLALALLALVPVAAVLGVTFPLLLHLDEAGGAQRRTGRLYAWNTAGAMAGALLADLVLVKALGLQGSGAVLAGLALAAGTAAALSARGFSLALAASAGVAVASGALVAAPRFRPWNPVPMTAGVYEYGLEWKDRPGFRLVDLARERRILFYEEGREAVVAVGERTGSSRRFLSVNGKTDAGSGAEDVLTQKLIAHLPLLLHEAPKSALVVGWGAGATVAAAALHPVERLECVEIEPATFRAASFFADLSGAVRQDPRFRMVFRDGRTHLLRSRESYDVIVSEPSNPWITGVANLFTREFYETVRGRLSPRGVFGQWFHYYRFEPADVKIEILTFASVFPHASLWLVPPTSGPEGARLAADLLLVGSLEPHVLEWRHLQEALGGPVGDDLRTAGIAADAPGILAAWAMDGEAMKRYARDPSFPRGTPQNTDDHPLIELRAPRRNLMPRGEVARLASAQYEALAAAGDERALPLQGLPEAEGPAFWTTLGRRYEERAQPARAVAAFERAVAMDGARVLAWERLAILHLERRDFARAEQAHRAFLQLRPADVDAWLRLAAVCARQSKWVEARDAIERARRLDPKAPVDPALADYLARQATQVAPRDAPPSDKPE